MPSFFVQWSSTQIRLLLPSVHCWWNNLAILNRTNRHIKSVIIQCFLYCSRSVIKEVWLQLSNSLLTFRQILFTITINKINIQTPMKETSLSRNNYKMQIEMHFKISPILSSLYPRIHYFLQI